MTEQEKNKMNELIVCIEDLTKNVNKMCALQIIMIRAIAKLFEVAQEIGDEYEI